MMDDEASLASTVTVEMLEVTGTVPFSAVPLTVALLVTEPLSTSAWDTV